MAEGGEEGTDVVDPPSLHTIFKKLKVDPEWLVLLLFSLAQSSRSRITGCNTL